MNKCKCRECEYSSRLKIFYWPEYARDYTAGIAVVVAHSEREARELLLNADNCASTLPELAQIPEMLEIEPVAFFCHGGG
ncbi:hypothetical protein NO1_1959 [Candidatus Termititenax aidoneus]|uniref:Uncharacterized protein n=1 Tax=Termititenax aidoneus TaxID=2218524 RepID=A0A388TD87_TERA1|nr:hypothetical protein NO1_1959 [Candidatus Termititenax aidoneus]